MKIKIKPVIRLQKMACKSMTYLLVCYESLDDKTVVN